MKKAKALALAITIALALAACANPLVTGRSKAALENLLNQPMSGYSLSETFEPVCGIDHCDVNYRYFFKSTDQKLDRPTFCKNLLDWAMPLGADSWMADADYTAIPIKGHESVAQVGCVGELNFSLLGTAENGTRWMIEGNNNAYSLATILNKQGEIDDERMVYHEWDEVLPLLFNGTRAEYAVLEAINSYRFKHPNQDPNSPTTIEEALKAYPTIKLEKAPKVEIIKNKQGQAKFVLIHKDTEFMARCLSIEPFDESYFLTKNTGTGFFGMYITEENPMIYQFGYMRTETCPKP